MDFSNVFDRNQLISKLNSRAEWDLIIIGGGATGLGIAVDAASRGYATLLLEQSDFAKGTSSRSTKLVHGGVRYLAQGDIKLVYDALRERGILLKNAPHLVKQQSFIIPVYSLFAKLKYGIGLKMYDWLSGRFSFGKSKLLLRKQVLNRLPGINGTNLAGGIEYFDGQFDDARLAINLAQTAAQHGGVVLNYMQVKGLQKSGGKVTGVVARDGETGKEYNLTGKAVINATGVFVDDVLRMDTPDVKPLVRPSQGVHVVLDRSFLAAESALMIPETADGRVLFAVPWHNHVVVGTTDTPLKQHSLEPVALQQEVDFILNTLKQYVNIQPGEKDVLSVFAGLRPLAAPKSETDSTKEISRDHKLIVSPSGLITITGGKWTTYRKMGEETVDKAIETAGLAPAACATRTLRIHGCAPRTEGYLSIYGTDAEGIEKLMQEEPALRQPLKSGLPYTEAEVVWAVRNEMARTVEDVLARRMRLLFLDARAAMEAAPRVAALMAAELKYDNAWVQNQLEAFTQLAGQYLLGPAIQRQVQPSAVSAAGVYKIIPTS